MTTLDALLAGIVADPLNAFSPVSRDSGTVRYRCFRVPRLPPGRGG